MVTRNWWEDAPRIDATTGKPATTNDDWWAAAPTVAEVAARERAAQPSVTVGPITQVSAEPTVTPDRTWGEALGDAALSLRTGARNATAGVLGTPVGLLNLVQDNPMMRIAGAASEAITGRPIPSPAQVVRALGNGAGVVDTFTGRATPEQYGSRAIQQPDAIRGTQAEIARANAEDIRDNGSTELQADLRSIEQAKGFFPTLGAALSQPDAAAFILGQQIPQMVMGRFPGSVGGTIAAQGVMAGAQAEDQIARELQEQVATGKLTPAQAADRAALAGQISTALNIAMPAAFGPSARAAERVLAGRPAAEAAGRSPVWNGLRSLAAEGAEEGVTEAGEQVNQNWATGKPLGEGVGNQAALGALLGATLGGPSGALEGYLARAEQAPPPANGDRSRDNSIRVQAAPPPQPPASPNPTAATAPAGNELADLLLRNVPREDAAPSRPSAPTAPVLDEARLRQALGDAPTPPPAPASAQAQPQNVTPTAGLKGEGTEAQAQPTTTMQNRDRSRAASVAQMQDIRKAPDPERLGFSRDPNTGAPMVAEGQAIPEADKGRTDSVTMASGRRVPVRYAVVEASDLAASHDADGRVNPGYDAAPLKALNNGRTAGLQAAWASGNADAYRAGIERDTALHGVSPEAIRGKRHPVLVRLYDPAQNTGDMGAESNASQQLGLSPVEQAQTDARALPDLAGIQWAEDGTITPAANADFFRAWFRNLGGTQAATLQDAQGRPNAEALRRVRAAMVQRAYGDERLLTALVEETNPDNRNVMNALVQAAPAFATLDADTRIGRDIREALVGGLQMLRDASARGLSLQDALAQQDMFGRNADADAVARYMAANARSAKRMAEAFKVMAEYASYAEQQAATLDVFGNAPTPTVREGMRRAGMIEDDGNARVERGESAAVGHREGEPREQASGRSPAGDAGDAGGFRLESGDPAAESPARAKGVGQPGLFGAPTARDYVDDARRRRDAERNGQTGTGRTDMLAGDGELFAGPRPEQTDIERSERPNPESAARGQREAEQLGLPEAVEKALGKEAGRVLYLHDHTGLPERLRRGVERKLEQRGGKGRTAALFDPKTGNVYVFTAVSRTPEQAAFNAAHEIAGHLGLRALLGDKLDKALEIARQNPTVQAVAESVARQRKLRPNQINLATEEALADLAGAVRTGNWDRIRRVHGVEVPTGIRASVKAAIENFLKRLRALLNRQGGSDMFSDADVRALLDAAWKAAQGDAVSMTLRGADGAVEQVVFHGTPHKVDRFRLDRIGTGEGAPDDAAPGSFENPLPESEMESAPVGAWVAGPSLPGLDTRRQIMDVPLDRIDPTEFDSAGQIAPEKRAYVARYAEAMRAGVQFPNGRGSELPNGMIKLQDGHRRFAAARSIGADTMRLAVSPIALDSPGASNGALQRTTDDVEARALLTPEAALESVDDRVPQDVLDRETRETEKAYGGRKAYDRAKAAGKTKLSYGQWVQVRTPRFKRWFGDWEAVRAQQRLDDMKPVQVRVPDAWRGLSVAELRQRVRDALDDLVRTRSTIPHPELGEIKIGRAGAGKTISEGRDPAKLLVAADLGKVLPSSVFASAAPSQGKASDSFAKLLARVEIDGHPLVAVMTVRRQPDGDWYYNTVALEDGEMRPGGSNRAPDAAGVQEQPTISGLADFVRRPLTRVNPATVSKVVDPETGEPLVVYHGTVADFDAFDNAKTGANDRGLWGRGHYLSASVDNANSYALRQGDGARLVPAFVSIKNPLVMKTGRDLVTRLPDGTNYRELVGPNLDGAKIKQIALDGGHDGVIQIRPNGLIGDLVSYSPNQIKSATGNRGAYDPEQDSILESADFEPTPEQEAFMRKAGVGRDTRRTAQKVRDWLRGKRPDIRNDAMIQGAVDRYWGLKQAVANKGGFNAERDPYLAARMINVASTMEAILRFGAPKMQGGALVVDRNVPGLFDALGPVQDKLPQFFGWMVARRAQLLKQQGRENLMTDEDIRAGLSLRDGHEADFDKAALGYLKLKNAILDFAEQHGGTIDPQARAAWDHAEYLPFYRDDGEGGVAGPGTRKGLANQSAGIRTLKGGEQNLRDPLANIIQNFTRLMDSALKNRAMLMAVDQLGGTYFKKLPPKVSSAIIPLDQVKKHLIAEGASEAMVNAMPQSALRGVGKMMALEPPTGENVVRLMRNGKAEYYEVADPLLLRSLTAFNENPVKGWEKPLIWAKNLLTAGATATPEFLIRNLLRDTGEAATTARERFVPVLDTMRGAYEALREDEFTQDLMMAGSYFRDGLFHQGDYDATSAAVRRALRRHGMGESAAEKFVKTLINPKRIWDLYSTAREASEMGSRVSLARNRVKAGGSFLEAAFEAKDFLDFSLRGDAALLQFLVRTIPFLNARLQGGYRLVRTTTAADRKRVVLGRLAMMATMTAALYAWNMLAYGDAYDELEDWDKDAYWHIAPGTAWHIRIPKPFELGLVGGTSVERGLAALVYQVTGGESGDRPAQTFMALLRGLTGTLAVNPIPQAVKPGAEVWFNQDLYFDRPIESFGDQYKAPSDRKSPYTSDTLVQASKAMEAALGDNALSPKQLQHLWRGYFGGMGMYLLGASDSVVRWLQDAPEKPTKRLRDIPVLKSVYVGDSEPSGTRYTNELYDLNELARTKSQAIKDALKAGEAGRARNLENEYRWLLGERVASSGANGGFVFAGARYIDRTTDQLAKLRKADLAVYESRTLTPDQKRERLDESAARRAKVARETVQKIRRKQRDRSP